MTLSGAGDQRLGSMRFKIVILDEASQATEPSTLIPLVRACAELHLTDSLSYWPSAACSPISPTCMPVSFCSTQASRHELAAQPANRRAMRDRVLTQALLYR